MVFASRNRLLSRFVIGSFLHPFGRSFASCKIFGRWMHFVQKLFKSELSLRFFTYVLPIPGPGPISDRRPDRTGMDRTGPDLSILDQTGFKRPMIHIIRSSYDPIIILSHYQDTVVVQAHDQKYQYLKISHATFWRVRPIVQRFVPLWGV